MENELDKKVSIETLLFLVAGILLGYVIVELLNQWQVAVFICRAKVIPPFKEMTNMRVDFPRRKTTDAVSSIKVPVTVEVPPDVTV